MTDAETIATLRGRLATACADKLWMAGRLREQGCEILDLRQHIADLTAARDALLEQLHAMAAAQKQDDPRSSATAHASPPAFPQSALRSGPWRPAI